MRFIGGEVAQIWFLYDGPQPTNGKPAYRLPVTECIDKLDVFKSRFCSDLSEVPRFNVSNTLGSLRGYRHTVMKLNKDEAAAFGWKAGYYRLELKPHEVMERLGRPEESQKSVLIRALEISTACTSCVRGARHSFGIHA